jgi:hypothetical protein
MAEKIAVSKDWVVVICKGDKGTPWMLNPHRSFVGFLLHSRIDQSQFPDETH